MSVRYQEYLIHLRKWRWFYAAVWTGVILGSLIFTTSQYQNQSKKSVYTATGVYLTEEPEIAVEWAYLAGLSEGASTRVPINNGQFFEITMEGTDKAILVTTIGDVLRASRNEQENVTLIRKPEAKLVSSPRTFKMWMTISFAISLSVIGIVHGVPLVTRFLDANYEHCPGCDCGKLGASTHDSARS